GHARSVGHPRQARPRPVRGRRHSASGCARSAAARRRQATREDALCCADRRVRAMKVADIRAMSLDQMDDEVLKLKKERFNLRFQKATGQLENTARVRQVRRDVARLKTIAAQKRVGTEPKVEAKAATKTESKPAPKKRAAKSKSKG